MKLYFTYGNEIREGFESKVPLSTKELPDESVDEITGEGILEKVPDLVLFLDECWRLLRKDGKCAFTSIHYASSNAWVSPLVRRSVAETSLNFTNKKWREENKFTEVHVLSDFVVAVNYAIEESYTQRSDLARQFMLKHYNNVIRAILFELIKNPT